MDVLRVRVVFSSVCGSLIFAGVMYRTADIMVVSKPPTRIVQISSETPVRKADIVDRHGEILATSITTYSCFADPSVVIDIDDTVSKVAKTLKISDKNKIRKKLSDRNKHFVWIARHIPPESQEAIMDLGLPGILLKKDYKRIYIHGPLFSHILGVSDIDGNGLCGLERSFNDDLIKYNNKKLVLSLDLRLQHIVHEELKRGVAKFNAIGGNAILMSIDGEIMSMVSLPDFDGNNIVNVSSLFNRNTLGVFEPGSVFKILNVAIALDSRSATLGSKFDAACPIRIGRHMITDFRGKNRVLSLAEAFVFSSNIASVKIAQNFGMAVQKEYLKNFGLTKRVRLEVPEVSQPLFPAHWTSATSMTVAYGYGIAVSPLQVLSTVTSIVGDGLIVNPTLLRGRSNGQRRRIVSSETSEAVRDLMRAVVLHGTGRKASVDGVEIFGKTGTAYKTSKRGYGTNGNRARITTFVGGFPRATPRYMLLVMLDAPQAIEGTCGYATAGWNVAPIAREIFRRITPILSDGRLALETELKVTKYIKFG
jgi:cell division protein FtsI (penicillin-binding protein 3)